MKGKKTSKKVDFLNNLELIVMMEILKFYFARIQVDFEIANRRDDVQP